MNVFGNFVTWQDIFESMGQFVDGLKFDGGSYSLMPKSFIKEVTDVAHQHDIYVSTGDWAENLLQKGPSGFKEYVEVGGLDDFTTALLCMYVYVCMYV